MKKDKLDHITELIIKFDKDRGWGSETPGMLTRSIVVEAVELLEHFQWDLEGSDKYQEKLKNKDWLEISYEVADVLWFLLKFCHYNGIDIYDAFLKKHKYNEIKRPANIDPEKRQAFYKEQHKKYRKEKKTIWKD